MLTLLIPFNPFDKIEFYKKPNKKKQIVAINKCYRVISFSMIFYMKK